MDWFIRWLTKGDSDTYDEIELLDRVTPPDTLSDMEFEIDRISSDDEATIVSKPRSTFFEWWTLRRRNFNEIRADVFY